MYGVDWDGPLPDDVTATTIVDVPSVINPLNQEHYGELCSEICPLATSTDYGIDLYQTCLHFVYSKLSFYNYQVL